MRRSDNTNRKYSTIQYLCNLLLILESFYSIIHCVNMWKVSSPIAFVIRGAYILLSVLFIVHAFIPGFLVYHLNYFSASAIFFTLCILKGLLLCILNALDKNSSTDGFLCAVVFILFGVLVITGILIKQNDYIPDEDESKVHMELRQLISNTSNTIERYL